MAVYLNSCITLPINLTDNDFQDLVQKTKDWTLMHGGGMRSKTQFSNDSLTVVPFTLLPSVFPRAEFQKAIAIQPALNELTHRVSNDHEFLFSCLEKTIEVDEFTRNLFKLYETVRTEGFTQRLSLGLLRSDVMLEKEASGECIKQVEMNTIASGFGWLGIVSGDIHRFVLQQMGLLDKLSVLPQNNALQGLSSAIIKAWELFNEKDSIILVIIEDQSMNICDQRFHEFEIARQKPELHVIRKTLTQISNEANLSNSKDLIVQGKKVAVVYYRAGYSPDHYHGEAEWSARLLIERSTAIKCPNIQYHLAGTKKVQQALATPGTLERFVKDAKKAAEIRKVFTGLYTLDLDENGEKTVKIALDAPERFVLKPQREGGGNNLYGEDIRHKLMSCMNSKERSAWILMDKINPPVQQNYLIRPNQDFKKNSTLYDVVSELGIFGTILCDGDNIIINEQVGHMMRTKLASCNEGGVHAGNGVLDSPFLIDGCLNSGFIFTDPTRIIPQFNPDDQTTIDHVELNRVNSELQETFNMFNHSHIDNPTTIENDEFHRVDRELQKKFYKFNHSLIDDLKTINNGEFIRINRELQEKCNEFNHSLLDDPTTIDDGGFYRVLGEVKEKIKNKFNHLCLDDQTTIDDGELYRVAREVKEIIRNMHVDGFEARQIEFTHWTETFEYTLQGTLIL